jgi:UDP-glucuronate 4-epimerase
VTVLVTGAAGFIGSKLAQSLSISGERVVGVDSFNDFYSIGLKRIRVQKLLAPSGVEVREFDITNNTALKKLLEEIQPTSIYHLAAQAGVRLPIKQVKNYVDSNLVGFSNVLTNAVEQEIPNLLYASSSSVYGNSKNLPYNESDLTIRPVSFYGATKLSNELIVPTLVRGSSTRARGLRLFTVYGSWGRPDMAYFRLINSALNDANFDLFGDGKVTRDFTYIDDVIFTIQQLARELSLRTPTFSDVVNVGGGNPASMNEMIDIISTYVGVTLKINKVGMHHNDVDSTNADPSYLQSLIGVSPKTQLLEGLSHVIEWGRMSKIRENLPNWIKSSV